MSSNGNGNKKDKERTYAQSTAHAIDSSVSWLDNLWDRHATKVVLVVLLLVLVFWYRKEVTDTVSAAASAVGSAAGSAAGAAGLSSDKAPVAATMSAQVAPGELGATGVAVPTASEIRALFNF